MKLTLPSMVVLTALEMIVVSGTPIDTGIPDISRTLDCKVFDTPESCNTFCAAVFCFGHKDVMTRTKNKDYIKKNRQAAGTDLHPFQDDGIRKYGTWRRNDDCTIADEYPLATSYEGGKNLMMGPRAIIQGATKADQQRQADWAKKVWSSGGIEIADAQKVKLVLSAWDPVLSPYCEAWKNNDQSICKNKDSPFFVRTDDTGPHGRAVFQRIGLP